MTNQPLPHVTVLMGGWNAEAAVSRDSGAGVAASLERLGYPHTALDLPTTCPKNIPQWLLDHIPPTTGVIFNALHGIGVEDGTLQGFLNLFGVPYTHSGVLASAVAMDKPLAKNVFASHGIPVPPGQVVDVAQIRAAHVMPPPYVVKPLREGSSVGVTLVKEGPPPLLEEWTFGPTALVEAYIPGREFFVSIMGGRILGCTEIVTERGFYDYTAKYTPGHTQYITPPVMPESVRDQAYAMTQKAFEVLGCRGIARTDIRYDPHRPEGQQLFLLEINTQPGFTALSLVPKSAAMAGLSYDDLVAWLVANATCDPGFA